MAGRHDGRAPGGSGSGSGPGTGTWRGSHHSAVSLLALFANPSPGRGRRGVDALVWNPADGDVARGVHGPATTILVDATSTTLAPPGSSTRTTSVSGVVDRGASRVVAIVAATTVPPMEQEPQPQPSSHNERRQSRQ